ncbi:hypothetical protein, partial [Moraxella catarrhalis]
FYPKWVFFSGFKGFCGVIAVFDNNFIDFLIGRDFGGNDRTIVILKRNIISCPYQLTTYKVWVLNQLLGFCRLKPTYVLYYPYNK